LILDQFLSAPAESKRAAAGWAGDRYEIYEGAAPSDVCVAQMTVWDTETDAKEFFDAYARRTLKRYPSAKPTTSTRERGERREWQTPEGGIALELRGSRVMILEGIPQRVEMNRMVRLLWQ